MHNISIWFAFTAGIFSFFSPCIFPLVPAYVSHLTDSSFKDGKVVANKRVLLIRSLSFILGFSVIFVAMGASASFIGQVMAQYRDLVEKISGILIILFGLQMLGVLKLRILMMEKRVETNSQKKVNFIRSFLIGMAFGSGWTPCVGLALASILLLASSTNTVYAGMGMLWIYSLGLGIPFILISFLVTYSLKWMKKINKWLPKLSILNGCIMLIMGILLFTGQMAKISSYLSAFTS